MYEALILTSQSARSLCITHKILLIRKILRMSVINLALFLESVIVIILYTKGLANNVIILFIIMHSVTTNIIIRKRIHIHTPITKSTICLQCCGTCHLLGKQLFFVG
jgi:hypothetical protein